MFRCSFSSSEPPDIKNWFPSYEYESPEASELVPDPAVDNDSETQDPFEVPLPCAQHSLFKHSYRDDVVTLRGNCLRDQCEPEVFAGKYLIPDDKTSTKPAPKRKQSLRTLFGAGFLDKDEAEETTETESQSLLHVQGIALQPLSDYITSLPDRKQSQEGSTEQSKVLENCDDISSVDTQEIAPADQEVEYSKQSVDCDDARMANVDTAEIAVDAIDQIPLDSNCVNLACTEENTQDGVEHSIRPVSHNDFILADTEENSPLEETRCCKVKLDRKRPQEIVASDGFIAVKRKENRPDECKMNKIPRYPTGREKGKGKLQENKVVLEQKVSVQEQTRRPLADRTNFSGVATVAPPAQGVSKKWKCPSKGKPFVGRPMKQLRLEQWVRRMN
nr:unnamed protein product [Digitaria exilis]